MYTVYLQHLEAVRGTASLQLMLDQSIFDHNTVFRSTVDRSNTGT